MLRTFLWLAVASFAFAQNAPIRGFSPNSWKQEHEREEQAKAQPQQERLKIYMERMTAQPHHAGSPGSKAVADYAVSLLREWGLDARIETFEALMPYPTTRVLEMVAPVRYRASLKEPPIEGDPQTGDESQIPSFNAYSAAGDVTAPLVYVNYGLPEDYDLLKRQGIDVRGKIVIARYGRSWRGLKPKVAQENGAAACLLYSDPRDDGYYQNDVYPKGPMRPSQSVQRGSVMDMMIYPGDPLSPGWASEPGSKRLTRDEASTLLKIPVMPISYGDAQPFLEQLSGALVPEQWRGALPITYHAGPGPALVHFKIDFDWSNRPLYNVIATIPGSSYKDEWVIYGNHHDAWVEGASDPGSGASVLLETARTLSILRSKGWQPKRTIVLALWDGEEFGLLGSTEWLEKHLDEMDRKAAVYINSDSTGRGPLGVAGSHSLEAFMNEVLRDVADPGTGGNLLASMRDRRRGQQEFHLESLGSGSDYVPFLDHAGIASLNLGFGSFEGVYHSSYDTLNWYQNFSDGDRTYSRALTQVMSTTLLRLSDATVLPFEFGALSSTINRYLGEIRKDLPHRPEIDIQEVAQQSNRLSAAAKAYEEEFTAWSKKPGALTSDKFAKVNEALERTERSLLQSDGLPQRSWYRHQIYAPGMSTGYAAKTLPGLREAVEAKQWDEANRQAHRLAQTLHAAAAQIETATNLLKQAGD